MLTILLSNWTYQEFMEFNVSHQQGKARRAFELASKVITDWDYSADLDGTKNPVMELNPIESASVMREIIQKVDEFTRELPLDAVDVHLDRWSTGKFLDFNDAQQSFDFNRVERMMHEVAEIDGVEPSDTLSAPQGMAMQMAISNAYRKAIAGKN